MGEPGWEPVCRVIWRALTQVTAENYNPLLLLSCTQRP